MLLIHLQTWLDTSGGSASCCSWWWNTSWTFNDHLPETHPKHTIINCVIALRGPWVSLMIGQKSCDGEQHFSFSFLSESLLTASLMSLWHTWSAVITRAPSLREVVKLWLIPQSSADVTVCLRDSNLVKFWRLETRCGLWRVAALRRDAEGGGAAGSSGAGRWCTRRGAAARLHRCLLSWRSKDGGPGL